MSETLIGYAIATAYVSFWIGACIGLVYLTYRIFYKKQNKEEEDEHGNN